MWTPEEATQLLPIIGLVLCYAVGFIAGQQR
jgi:hypothetical protein